MQTPTRIRRREIPALPERPRVPVIAGQIRRLSPVHFSRVTQGQAWTRTVTAAEPLPENVSARLVMTAGGGTAPAETVVPFTRADEHTLVCRVTPQRPGLYTLRVEFSPDEVPGELREQAPDSWLLVDPPQVEDLRLYTLIPTVSGAIADWKADLRRIRDMGFNAVHLLPVTPMDVTESPYAAQSLFDVDPSYLSPASPLDDGLTQLEDFLEEARALGIRLCFDLVLNHVGVTSDLAERAPDWIVPDESQTDGFKRAGYWSEQGWLTWDDLALINYQHPSGTIRAEIWEYMTAYALFWSQYAHATGGFVRLDNLHSSDVNFVQALTERLHAEYPGLGILAECFTDEQTLRSEVTGWGLHLILATPWQYKFVPQLRDYFTYLHRDSGSVRYFMPITSHDSGTPTQEFGTPDSTAPRYVAAALLGTGATGMTQGVEWGQPERLSFIGRQPRITPPDSPWFAPLITQVNDILAAHPVFRHAGNCRFMDGGHDAVIAAFRRDSEPGGAGYLVVCNFDTYHPQPFATDLGSVLGADGPFTAQDLLTGEEYTFPDPRLELLLPPCATQVLMFTARPA